MPREFDESQAQTRISPTSDNSKSGIPHVRNWSEMTTADLTEMYAEDGLGKKKYIPTSGKSLHSLCPESIYSKISITE